MTTTDLRPAAPDAPAAPGRDIAEEFGTGGWEFTPQVVGVFPEHVRASVPFYDAIQQLVAEVADWALPAGGVFADLGASTGETLQALLRRHAARKFTAHLYDESGPMLDRAKTTLNAPGQITSVRGPVLYHQQRIQEPLQHDAADLTVSLFTLQFLPPADRVTALANARERAADTGCLIVAEKIRPQDARWAEIANDRSHDWKADHGIPDEAIRAKARALRGVLIPSPVPELRQQVTDAGWGVPETLFAWHNWLVLGTFAT